MGLLGIYKNAFIGLSPAVWILSAAMLINRTGAMVLPFMSLYLTIELGFSLPQAGFAMAFYGLGSMFGSFIGGWLTDKYGYHYVQLTALIGGALVLLPLLVVTNYYGVILCIFAFSLLADMFRPANAVAIVNLSKPENRTRSLSLNRLAMNLGFSLGPTLGGVIAALLGFKWIFLFDSLTCIGAGWVIWTYLPRPHNKKMITTETIEQLQPQKSMAAYRDIKFITFLLLVTLFGLLFFQLFSTFPVFLDRDLNYSEAQIGLILGLNGLLVFLMEMPIVSILEKYKRPMILVAVGCLMMTVSFLILLISNWGLGIILFFIFLITLAEIFAMPFMLNYALNKPPSNRRGQYMAFYSIAFGLSHVVGPSFGMNIANTFDFYTLFIVLSAFSLIAAIGYYGLRRRKAEI
jgi:predicted MFS family arabinose efflux permease